MSLTQLEEAARRAKNANSFSDYKPGSATAEYNSYCARADEIAQHAKDKLTRLNAPAERIEKVDYLLANYKAKKLAWLQELYTVESRVPSVMIAGPAKFPVRAKEKQLARERTLWDENPDYILDEIKGIGYNAKTIYSDDENAVERIKEKIEALKAAPDPYGNKSAEIRRLKERLLQLAPELFAEQQANITVNGVKTYDEIVALWQTGRIHKSQYDPDRPEWYYDLMLDFTDGKRHYRGMVSIQVDEAGESMHRWNHDKRCSEFVPLTESLRYNLIIGQISGSGNKAVIYKHLESLTPKAQARKAAEAETEQTGEEISTTATINGETAKVVCNKEEMRLQLFFEGKPSDKTRETLKSNGFRWAPSNMAWQRLLNGNAESALRRMTDK
jgi:hypothetical protein